MTGPIHTQEIGLIGDEPDDLFVCFARDDDKCRGAVSRLSDYAARRALVFEYGGAGGKAAENAEWIRGTLSGSGPTRSVVTTKGKPVYTARRFRTEVLAVSHGNPLSITLDVTSFSKPELLLVLRVLDSLKLLSRTRVLYTEPDDYDVTLVADWVTPGIREISVLPTFKGRYNSQRELVLVLFLGYEGERALATWDNVAPNTTYAVLPRPPYRPEWNGRAERHNAALLAALDPAENVRTAHSLNPTSACDLLYRLVEERGKNANWYVSHLGTKPQLIGLYHFMSRHPGLFSVMDSKPYGDRFEYEPQGIGPTWILPLPPTP